MKSLRFLIMAWFLLGGAIGTGLIGPSRSAVRLEYGLSETAYGVGLAAIQISSAVSVLLLTTRLARFNPVSILTASLIIQVFGFLCLSLVHHILGPILGWTLIVVGSTLGFVIQNISMDLWPQNPRRGIMLLHSFNAMGKVVGPLIAAALFAVAWRASFVALGLVTFTLAVVALILHRHGHAAIGHSDTPPRRSGEVFARPDYWFFMLALGVIAGGEVAFATLLPEYLENVRGTSPQIATLAFTVHLVGLMVGRFATAWWGHRVSSDTVLALCLSSGLFVIPVLLLDNMVAVFTCLFFLGAMFSSTWPTFYASASAGRLRRYRDMLPYGAALGCYVCVSLCIIISSVIADHSHTLAVAFGPFVLGLFALVYFGSRLVTRRRSVDDAISDPSLKLPLEPEQAARASQD